MTEVLRERAAAGVGVVFSSHQLDLVEDVCEDVVIIARGRVVAAGAIDELKAGVRPPASRGRGRRLGRRWLDGRAGPDGPRARRRPGQAARRRRSTSTGCWPRPAAGEVRRSRTSRRSCPSCSWRRCAPDDAAPGGRLMTRWRSIWLVARREILERGRSRGFILSVAVHDAHRGRLVRRPGPAVRRRRGDQGRGRRAGAGRPAAAIEASAARVDREVDDLHLSRTPRRPTRRSTTARSRSSSVPADLSGPGDVRFQRGPRPGGRPDHLGAPSSACASRRVLDASDVDQAAPGGRAAAAGRRSRWTRRPRTTRRASCSPTSAPS